MIIDYWKENGELYENIMFLAIDIYRNAEIEQWKKAYSFFAERYTAGMSERLNISQQFALSIFIYFIGLSFHSLAFDGDGEYKRHIDGLETVLRPMIVDAPDDMENAAQKFKKIISTVLMNQSDPPKTTVEKKNIRNKKKTAKNKKSRNSKDKTKTITRRKI
jgi:hypothetical protein